MKRNMGSTDKIIRVIIAIVIAVLYWQGMITGTLATVLLLVGSIFLLTSLAGFCPGYLVIGMSTCKVKEK
ncbi:MAG: hypothetical protein COC16_02295 [Lutibacter sp.]|nr:MAG: hypothetical protein COC16_02295 [Lutibacter sp.]